MKTKNEVKTVSQKKEEQAAYSVELRNRDARVDKFVAFVTEGNAEFCQFLQEVARQWMEVLDAKDRARMLERFSYLAGQTTMWERIHAKTITTDLVLLEMDRPSKELISVLPVELQSSKELNAEREMVSRYGDIVFKRSLITATKQELNQLIDPVNKCIRTVAQQKKHNAQVDLGNAIARADNWRQPSPVKEIHVMEVTKTGSVLLTASLPDPKCIPAVVVKEIIRNFKGI